MGTLARAISAKMVGKFQLFYFLTLLPLIFTEKASDIIGEDRDKRVFSLFSVVTFPNSQCTGKSSGTIETLGTCFSSTECTSKGGTADGNCASGFGVCCTFVVTTCGSSVPQNCSYIQNPKYPATEAASTTCAYNIKPLSTDICQLRLDFDFFDITEVTTAAASGICTDSFSLTSGSSRKYYDLCGVLTGQHIYVETGRKTTDQIATFTMGTGTTSASWRIKVNQIECFSPSKAPADCFQYYTGTSGTVSSLNFPNIAMIGLSYNACIRRESGMCGIHWSEDATASPDPFTLDDANIADAFVGPLATTLGATAFIQIPGSLNTLYSGLALSDDSATIALAANVDEVSSVIRAYGMPFMIGYYAMGDNAGNANPSTAATGFKLVWNQINCGSYSTTRYYKLDIGA